MLRWHRAQHAELGEADWHAPPAGISTSVQQCLFVSPVQVLQVAHPMGAVRLNAQMQLLRFVDLPGTQQQLHYLIALGGSNSALLLTNMSSCTWWRASRSLLKRIDAFHQAYTLHPHALRKGPPRPRRSSTTRRARHAGRPPLMRPG